MTDMPDVPMPDAQDLALIGAALLNFAVATIRLGHVTPAETLDYTQWDGLFGSDDSAAPTIVRDFVAWTGRRQHLAPGAEQRLRDWLDASGWIQHLLEDAAELRRGRVEESALDEFITANTREPVVARPRRRRAS